MTPALSIRQPWASLIVAGVKDVENRSWPTRYHGTLLIHAGKRLDRAGVDFARRLGVDLDPDDLPSGGIIGAVDVVGCVRDSGSPWAMNDRWHWQLTDAREMPFKPVRGQLGLFRVKEGS